MPKHERCELGNRTVRYLRVGEGRPLIFFQGFGVKPGYYAPLFKRLGESFEVIAPDVLRARSMRNQPQTFEGHVELLMEFCASLGVGKHDLVGHSMGGAMAYTLGSRTSDVQRIVGINPLLPVGFGWGGFALRSSTAAVPLQRG